MKHFSFFAAVFFLFFSIPCIGGILNEYGKFVVTDTGSDYAVTFVLDSANKKFPKIKKVTMVDYGNDGEGDLLVLLYKSGNKEVFFRTEDAYRRYVLKNISAKICEDGWSPKIIYHEDRHAWACSKLNFLAKFFMWREIDSGFVEAKAGDWDTFAERIMENVKKIKK
jgi:hypothetical protein